MSSESKPTEDTQPSTKMNCWDYRNCGREIGGTKVEEKGVCPAAVSTIVNGINHGMNGGRVCWAVAGTLGGRECNLTFSQKIVDCVVCDFYQKVLLEEDEFEMYPVHLLDD
jgi:hypothetical protein